MKIARDMTHYTSWFVRCGGTYCDVPVKEIEDKKEKKKRKLKKKRGPEIIIKEK